MKKNKVRMAKLVRLRDQAAEGIDRKLWQDAGHEARFSAAWGMIGEQDAVRGGDGIKHRLQKSVQNIVRSRR